MPKYLILVVLTIGVCHGRAQGEEPALCEQRRPEAWAEELEKASVLGQESEARLGALALRQYDTLPPEVLKSIAHSLQLEMAHTSTAASIWPAAEVLVERGEEGVLALLVGLEPALARLLVNVEELGVTIDVKSESVLQYLAGRLPQGSSALLARTLGSPKASDGQRAAAAALLALDPRQPRDAAVLAMLETLSDVGESTPLRAYCEAALSQTSSPTQLVLIGVRASDEGVLYRALLLSSLMKGMVIRPRTAASILRGLLASTNVPVRILASTLALRSHALIEEATLVLIAALGSETQENVVLAAKGLARCGATGAPALPGLRVLAGRSGEIALEARRAIAEIEA
ncbi:MAG: hypothetical protein KAI66_27685, partial [Lentisphaeria bacterium]|nr:hypothetical protein [Lentisphaeria bacterium]